MRSREYATMWEYVDAELIELLSRFIQHEVLHRPTDMAVIQPSIVDADEMR